MVGYVTLYRSSPGDLAKAHAAVAGSPFITDCNKCHANKELTPNCLRCHTEIQGQLQARHGYHDFLMKNKKPDCVPCHSEHNGSEFQLINKVSWQNQDLKKFTHPGVDYRLNGKHLDLACEACHSRKGQKPFALPKFPKNRRALTYLGLDQVCGSCHKDPHAGGLAEACAKCHGQAAWKPAPDFNHDKFFPLKGGHDNLACKQCHPLPGPHAERVKTQAFPFDRVTGRTCQECHANPHRTRWVEGCEACHKANDLKWSVADVRMPAAQHAVAGFRLSSPHNKVSCRQCHTPELSFDKKYPNPKNPGYNRWERSCEGCHRDEHRGQFIKKYPRCIGCHSRTAFKPSIFSAKDHKTYPLIGGHLTAACNTCHVMDRRTGVRQYVPTPQACALCHKDIHYGQFRKPDGTTRCEDCHQSALSWTKLVFDHNTQSRFKLDQAHAKVACKECHPRVTVQGIQLIQYKPLRMKCRDCHDFDH